MRKGNGFIIDLMFKNDLFWCLEIVWVNIEGNYLFKNEI